MSDDDNMIKGGRGQNDGEYKANKPYGLTNKFQAAWLQNLKAYESGKKHKEHAAAWQQAQKDKAAWQQPLDKVAKYTAQLRSRQAAGPKLLNASKHNRYGLDG
eukprot:1156053-Pelagomonas_calceolata.AAC.5